MSHKNVAQQVVAYELKNKGNDQLILGFHVTSSNSKIQNREAYRILTFIQGKIT